MSANRIRMAMVGGGHGAFIGAVHRKAAALDGAIELVCGAFSADAAASQAFGESLGLDAERCYPDYQSMFEAEASLPSSERCQFVSIVTPNHLHYDIATAAFQNGFHVFCEKPATVTTEEALRLSLLQEQSGCLFGLAHTYTGYPMIKAARDMVAAGELGRVVKIVVEYTQGWLASPADDTSKQAAWRLDPSKSGPSGCIGDIGVHGANLAEYVTGLAITEINAELTSIVPGRVLDDDGSVLLRFDNGAKGVLVASQIHIGDENNLRLRVVGDRKAIEWSQLEPGTLWVKSMNESTQMRRLGVGEYSTAVSGATRLPAGHPEGYIEAFANLYCDFASMIDAYERGASIDDDGLPGMQAAIRGMAFIENVVASDRSGNKWFPNTIPATSERAS